MSFWRKKEEASPPVRSRSATVVPPRARPPPRAPVLFDDASLLAELGFTETPDDEAALMAAALALDENDGEAELLARLEGDDEEVTAVLAALGVLDEEEAHSAEELRAEVLSAKRHAVSAKQNGDMEAARQHLRRSKELQAQLETLECGEQKEDEAALAELLGREAPSRSPPASRVPSSPPASAGSARSGPPSTPPSAGRREAILAAKREALALKRGGDLLAAKAALARARELERLDAGC